MGHKSRTVLKKKKSPRTVLKKKKKKKPAFVFLDMRVWARRRLYRSLSGILLKDQLLRNYMHIGLRGNQTHQGFRGDIIGTYAGCSIFHPDILVHHFRRTARLLTLILKRGNRLCIVSKDFEHHFFLKELLFPGQLTILRN